MSLAQWPARFWETYGGRKLPRNYLVIDSETTGFSELQDLILQLGFIYVVDGKVLHRFSACLNWLEHPGVDPLWVADRILRMIESYQKRGLRYPLSLEMIRNGEPPLEVLRGFHEMCCLVQADASAAIIGHNLPFEEKFVAESLRYWLEIPGFFFGPRIIDTGALAKAEEIGEVPHPNESAAEFFRRVLRRGGRGQWNLHRHCIERYRLDEIIQVAALEIHTALDDCELVRALYDRFIEKMEAEMEAAA